MRDLPDDHVNGYYGTGSDVMELYYRVAGTNASTMSDPAYQINPRAWFGVHEEVGESDWELINTVFSQDAEPDLFMFNFAGRSGKFVIDGERSDAEGKVVVRTLPQSELKIEMTKSVQGGFGEWTITDESGTKYVFAAEEKSDYIDSGLSYFSTWHLTRIESPAGDTIQLHYSNENQTYSLAYNQPVTERTAIYASPGCYVSNPDRTHSSQVEHFRRHLTSIETDKEILEFKTSLRDDLVNFAGEKQAKRLDEIVVKSKSGTNSTKRTIRFQPFYFDTTDPNGERNSYPMVPTSAKRYGLRGIDVIGATGEKQSWRFRYYDESSRLESRFSRNIDHWGYPNGETNTTLIPETKITEDVSVGEADRSPAKDVLTLLPGALKTVKYPTGGTSTFEYELNDYGSVEYEDLNEERVTEHNEQADVTEYPGIGNRSTKTVDTSTFTVSTSSATSVLLTLTASTPDVIDGNHCKPISNLAEDNPDGECAVFRLKNTSTGKEQVFRSTQDVYFDSASPTYKDSVSLSRGDSYELTTELYFYTEESYDDTGNCPDGFESTNGCTASIQVQWEEPTGEIRKTKIGGGLRVKKIIRDDGNPATESEIKRFRYRMPSEPDRSSGVLVTEPRYEFESKEYPLWIVGGTSMTELGRSQGAVVGYQYVDVLHGPADADGNPKGGYTRHWFTTSKLDRSLNLRYSRDGSQKTTSLPFGLQVLRPWKYGLKRGVTTYSVGSTPLQSKKRALVLTDENPRVTPVRFNRVLGVKQFSVSLGGCQTSSVDWHAWYEEASGFTYPREVRVEDHSEDGPESVTRTTTTRYADPDHLLPTAQVESTSNGQSRTTRYTYAHQVTCGGSDCSDYTQMGDDHMLSQKYRTSVIDEEGRIIRRSWQTWKHLDLDGDSASDAWVPGAEWTWTGE